MTTHVRPRLSLRSFCLCCLGAAFGAAEGWLTSSGEYLGRPVDVAVLRDGSLLVSDDFVGAL